MNSLFNAALFVRTTTTFAARCLSSGVIQRRIDCYSVNVKNGLLLTRLCASCSRTTRKASGSVGKVKKSRKSDSKIMGEEKNAFFVVRKGDLVGAQVGSSICDPPVSVYKGHSMPKEAEEYMTSCGLKNALYSIKAADLTEELFGNLVACPYQQPHAF
nr:ribonuclease H1 [Tanacetum cinerariifolium]